MCEPLLYRLRVPKGDHMDGRMLYFECYSGISGDMAVAAMLDLGADREALDRALSSLDLKGFRTEVTRVSKSGLDVCDFNVILDEDNQSTRRSSILIIMVTRGCRRSCPSSTVRT